MAEPKKDSTTEAFSTVGVDISEEKLEELYKQAANFDKAGILIIGNSGVGKTTLINTCFGKTLGEVGNGNAVTQHIVPYFSDDFPVVLYDSKGIETGVDPEEYKRTTSAWIERAEVHLCYYVVNADAHRWLEYDTSLAKMIQEKIPLLVVLTHCDAASPDQTKKLSDAIKCDVDEKNIIHLGLPPNRVVYYPTKCPSCEGKAMYIPLHGNYFCMDPKCAVTFDIPETLIKRGNELLSNRKKSSRNISVNNTVDSSVEPSVELINGGFDPATDEQYQKLINRPIELLPENVQTSFRIAVNDGTPKRRFGVSIGIITASVAGAGAAGASPIPIADLPILVSIQVSMFFGLATTWGVSTQFTKSKIKSMALAAVGSIGAFAAIAIGGSALASALKLIPGVGTVVGGIINASVATTFTLTLGIVFTIGFYDIWKYGGSTLDEIEAKLKKAMESAKRIFKKITGGQGPTAILESELQMVDDDYC